MAIRIYALAKELDVDSKELVDVCTRAGVTGKGSALASLTEDEVKTVKAFLAGGDSGGAATATATAAPAAPERPRQGGGDRKMKVIVTPKATSPRRKKADPAEEAATAEAASAAPPEAPAPADDSPAEDATQPAAAESQASEAAEAEAPKREERSGPGPLAGMLRKEDYIGPGGHTGKPPVLGGGRKDEKEKPGDKGKKNDGLKPRPTVRLAAMPKPAAPPKPKQKAEEGPAQKPDMKLPADVLGGAKAGGKSGGRPLADLMSRAERTLEAEKIKERTGGRGGRTGAGTGTDDDKRDGRDGKGKRPMLGGREQRQAARTRTPGRRPPRMPGRRRRRSGVSTAAPRKGRIEVQLPCTIRDLSEAAGVQARDIQRILLDEGLGLHEVNLNVSIDPDLTELVAAELGMDVDFIQPQTLEDKVFSKIEDVADPEGSLVTRPPVITFLGHVDHGKTSLIDKLIGIDVASGESGGITQHIRAYQIENNGSPISFVDTPGHEAFTAMRARGANVTDIAVLVVAADDGVMPQTEEAISHARAAEVPIIVALNKADLPGVDFNKVMADLAANDLQPSEWGGDVEVVKTSALTGEGLDDLLDTILTVAELHEYNANPGRSAIGACLEARQEADMGVITKLIVQRGTLRVGDIVVCGDAYGRVKAMVNPLDPAVVIEEAGPSCPVDLLGFDTAPSGGQSFYVLDDIAQAREIAEERATMQRTEDLMGAGYQQVTLDTLYDRLDGAEEVQTLNLIIRADVRGSIDAIKKELGKLEHPEVRLRILQASVGGVTEADVQLAIASEAIICAFNVVPDERARSLADQRGVEVRRYSVIYKITDDLKAALEGMLKPEQREVELGRALIQQVFKISRVGAVAGCRVLQGVVERNARSRVIRDSTVIGDYPIETLRREKDDTKEVREGYECGIKLAGFNDIKEADLLEVYKVEEVGRSFDD
ncbi:MAG: translation initiation factor IF-2 [Planctomycetota bacterium]